MVGCGDSSKGGIDLALYVVATPIGNLDDISARAVRTLREADAIIAEDTRTYRKLATRHSIPNKTVYSLYKGNESGRVNQLLPMLQKGLNAALVSESGTPAVSDPGALLLRRCLDAHVPVVPIPGPSALTAILSISGIFSDKITFLGFLSKKNPAADILAAMKTGAAVVFFEHPRRLGRTLERLADAAPGVRLVIGRELTKRFEEIWSGRIEEAPAVFGKRLLKGEIVVVIEPPDSGGSKPSMADPDESLRARESILKLRAAKVPLSAAVRQVARDLNLPRRALYAEALKLYSGENAPA